MIFCVFCLVVKNLFFTFVAYLIPIWRNRIGETFFNQLKSISNRGLNSLDAHVKSAVVGIMRDTSHLNHKDIDQVDYFFNFQNLLMMMELTFTDVQKNVHDDVVT